MSNTYRDSRKVPTEVIADRLDELARSIIRKGGPDWSDFYMRIPAEADHDADIVLSEAARRLRAITQSEQA